LIHWDNCSDFKTGVAWSYTTKYSNMDILTVTCDRDKAMQRLQSHSIDMFVTSPCTHWVVIESSEWSPDQWNEYLAPYYTKHSLRIINVPRDTDLTVEGWVHQQIIKLNVSKILEIDSYLCLDSKNFFVQPIDLAEWPVYEGNNTHCVPDVEDGKWYPWLDYVKQLTGQATEDMIFWHPETPFVIRMAAMQKLHNAINVNNVFLNFKSGAQSEFMLYRYFSETLPVVYTDSKNHKNVQIFWDTEQLPLPEHLDDYLTDVKLFLFGFHHRSLVEEDVRIHSTIQWLMDHKFDNEVVYSAFTSFLPNSQEVVDNR